MKNYTFSLFSIVVLIITFAATSARTADIVPRCKDPLPTIEDIAKAKSERKLWEGNQLGIIKDTPPTPWTPMVTNDVRVSCYGREYDFTDSLFPRQIHNQDFDILSRPITLNMKINGKEAMATKIAVKVQEQDKIHSLLIAHTDFDGVVAEVKNLVEFDGMLKITIRLVPQKKGLSLDRLFFDIPMKKEHSLLYNWKGFSMDPSESNAGRLPAEGLLGGFHGMVWLGDYERGLCWFAESAKNWHNTFPSAQIQVKNTEKENIIRINLVDSAMPLDTPLEIEFGIQATPVKPYPRSLREWSFTLNTWWAKGFVYPEPQLLEKGYSPKWYPITQDNVQPHNKNMRLLWSAIGPYAKCFSSGKVNSDYYVYYDEWKADPDEKIETTFPSDQWMGAVAFGWVCPRSSFADYYVWKIGKVIKNYNLKGLYTDGVCSECRNPAHGCGYVVADGNRKPEDRIFASREVMKRVYTLLREQSPEQTYWMNSANSIMPPLYAFNDFYLNGEYCNGGRMKVMDMYSKVLSPERIAAEYMGSQWGVAQYMLIMLSDDNAILPGPQRDLLALIMPHDVQGLGVSTATSILRRFNAGDAQFVGYWKKDKAVTCRDSEILVSYYQHDNKSKVLVIVSNLTDQVKETEMTVDSIKLFPTANNVAVKDFETGRNLTVNPPRGTISLVIKKHNLRILEVIPL